MGLLSVNISIIEKLIVRTIDVQLITKSLNEALERA